MRQGRRDAAHVDGTQIQPLLDPETCADEGGPHFGMNGRESVGAMYLGITAQRTRHCSAEIVAGFHVHPEGHVGIAAQLGNGFPVEDLLDAVGGIGRQSMEQTVEGVQSLCVVWILQDDRR